jgi:regulator of cell morphogenesis and NO signaling
MVIAAETPVRDIAVEAPAAIPVLERFGIDYCSGGKHTLAEACSKRDQDVASVLDELERRWENDASGPELQWQTSPLRDLIGYIIEKHHGFARTQLGLIGELAAKVERRHGRGHPEIYRLSGVLAVINAELAHHFTCEEDVLFPYIKRLEEDQRSAMPPVFGTMQQPVTRMMTEHNQTGDELRALREITNNYQPPADACTTYRALYRAMEDLELDLHQHIHLENNILFPRALKLEKGLA